jgi:hypothetical protein
MTNKCGTTAYSFTQQFLLADATRFAVGGKLYLYEAGTTTPVNGYKDTAAINVHPNPITLAADGRIPLIYFIMAHDNAVPGTFVTQRSSVRMRLTDASGVVQFDTDPVPLMTSDPAGGTGGVADTTDPDALYKTGDMKVRYGTGFLSGFVRANGKTLGSTASGATELANDVLAQALYLYLWQVDASLRSGSTTGSASSDFSSGKLLTLPDFSGRVLGFLDNMSDAARNVLTTLTFATAGRGPGVLGAASTWAEVLALGELARAPTRLVGVWSATNATAQSHDGERRPVLHRAAGVEELGLAEDRASGELGRLAQLDQRRVADACGESVTKVHQEL